MVKENKIRVLYKKPGKEPEWITVENELEPLQQLVGGHIEVVPWDDRYLMIVNEEGKCEGLMRNFYWRGDMIAGPAVWAAQDGPEFSSIRDDSFLDEIRGYCGMGFDPDVDDEDIISCDLYMKDLLNEMLERGGR